MKPYFYAYWRKGPDVEWTLLPTIVVYCYRSGWFDVHLDFLKFEVGFSLDD